MTSTSDTVQSLIAKHAHEPGGLLPLLHDIQDTLGFIPETHVDAIAKGMNRSRAEVHGVITYYHHFRTQPPARHVVQICAAEACKACGADASWPWLKNLGLPSPWHQRQRRGDLGARVLLGSVRFIARRAGGRCLACACQP